MSTSVSQIGALNLEGALQLGRGNSQAAVRAFHTALGLLESILPQDPTVGEREGQAEQEVVAAFAETAAATTTTTTTTTTRSSFPVWFPREEEARTSGVVAVEAHLDLHRQLAHFHPTAFILPILQDNLGYAFNRAILFEVCTAVRDSDLLTTCDAQLYSAVLLLNLALACHQEGARNALSKSFESALKFYGMSCQLLQDLLDAIPSSSVKVLLLIVYNNRAQVHFNQNQHDLARRCFDMASDLVFQLRAELEPTPQQQVDHHDLLPSDAVQGIMLNILMLTPPVVAPAA